MKTREQDLGTAGTHGRDLQIKLESSPCLIHCNLLSSRIRGNERLTHAVHPIRRLPLHMFPHFGKKKKLISN